MAIHDIRAVRRVDRLALFPVAHIRITLIL
jgi:hypothetical protein